MSGYLLKRVAEWALTLFALLTTTFFLLRLLPGGPFDRAVPMRPAQRAVVEARYGLDRNLPAQYGIYLGRLAHLDLGESTRFDGLPVARILAEGAPVSFTLGGLGFLLALSIGIPLGVESARRRGSALDALVRMGAAAFLSLPAYLSAALLLFFFSLRWELFPAAFWGGPEHWVLPVLALILAPAAQVCRLVRASVLEASREDFVRTARAKGAGEGAVFWRHAFRNSLLPLLTLAGPLAVNLVAGTFVVESIFALPGLGRGFVDSVSHRDYPLVLALTLGYGAFLVSINMLMDLALSWADPRGRARG